MRVERHPRRRPAWLETLCVAALACSTTAGCSRCSSEPSPEPSRKSPEQPASFSGEPRSGAQVPRSAHLIVDQFGYRPELAKVAIVSDPRRGWNAEDHYTPGTELELRRWSDGQRVYAAAPTLWNHGAIDELAGDRGYWFDFSSIDAAGEYFVYDPLHRVRSARVRIAPDAYREVLKAALRMFYFNRANAPKTKPFACVSGKCWLQGAAYVGPEQDHAARNVRKRDDAGSARDLSGGWWDAGDVDKYVTFAQSPVHQLLSAYTERPGVFGDDFNIPESHNGIPDLIDELKVELDWLEHMQPADLDGALLIKVGNIAYSEPLPEQSRFPRYYYPEPCSSATIAGAGMFAHAALVFRRFDALTAYADDLAKRARRAWDYYRAHPLRTDCDDLTIKSGDADRTAEQQERASVVAAIYLFMLTADDAYHDYIRDNYAKLQPFKGDLWSVYDPEEGDALLQYTSLENADPALKRAILQQKLAAAGRSDIYGFHPELDLYRAYMRRDQYHWGSNMQRANYGNTNYDMLQYDLATRERAPEFLERAAGLVHFFHGVNPLALVYLSQMEPYGAEHSVTQILHSWFRDGDPRWDDSKTSTFGPAPGFVVGGPNLGYCAGAANAQRRCSTSAFRRQPAGKAYLDFNTSFDPQKDYDGSWELSEPAIYYQAAYVKLLSKFVGPLPNTSSTHSGLNELTK